MLLASCFKQCESWSGSSGECGLERQVAVGWKDIQDDVENLFDLCPV